LASAPFSTHVVASQSLEDQLSEVLPEAEQLLNCLLCEQLGGGIAVAAVVCGEIAVGLETARRITTALEAASALCTGAGVRDGAPR
jgi:hypothetical protein